MTILVILCTSESRFAAYVIFLEGHGPAPGAEHKEISSALITSLSRLGIDLGRVKYCLCDAGSIMIAACTHELVPYLFLTLRRGQLVGESV